MSTSAPSVKRESLQDQYSSAQDRLQMLLEINNAVVSILDLRELISAIAMALHRVTPHEFISLSLYDSDRNELRVHASNIAGGKRLVREGMSMSLRDAPAGLTLKTRRPFPLTRQDLKRQFNSPYVRDLLAEGVQSGCGFPLIAHGELLGTMDVASLTEATFPEQDIEILSHIADQVAIAVENALAYEQILEMAKKHAEEKYYLEDQIRTEYKAPLSELSNQVDVSFDEPAVAKNEVLVSLEENERRHIKEVVNHTKGVIAGPRGAAEILKLPVSTLRSRMKKLGMK